MMNKNLTVAWAKSYIATNYGQARHDVKLLVIACRKGAKRFGVKPMDLFLLMIENRPIAGAYTHSYGFHTATGRAMIEWTGNKYYELEYQNN